MTEPNVGVNRIVFPFEAGIGVAKTVLYQLQRSAALYGVHFSYVKGPGWISAEYLCTVTGEQPALGRYFESVQDYFRRVRE